MTPIMSVPPPGIVAIQPVSEEEEMGIVMERALVILMMRQKILVQVMFVLVLVQKPLYLLLISVNIWKIVVIIVLPLKLIGPVMGTALVEQMIRIPLRSQLLLKISRF